MKESIHGKLLGRQLDKTFLSFCVEALGSINLCSQELTTSPFSQPIYPFHALQSFFFFVRCLPELWNDFHFA